jgi:hypothetical protein
VEKDVWLQVLGSGGIVVVVLTAIIGGVKWVVADIAGDRDKCCKERDDLIAAGRERLAAYETERAEELKRLRSEAERRKQAERLP